MKLSLLIVLACAIAVMLVAAGCTQTSQAPPTPTPTPVPTTIPTSAPTMVPTQIPTIPTPVPTTAPALPLPVVIKDTKLLFTISAPDGYSGSTIRAKTSDYSIVYKTTIFRPVAGSSNGTVNDNSGNYTALADSLTVFSYSSSLSVDQNIRNLIRGSDAVFSESSVTYNSIAYTRFDVAVNPYDGTPERTIIFVADKGSASETGYVPVLIYTMTPGDALNKATYENMVQSFQYYTSRNIENAPGTETDRPAFYQ